MENRIITELPMKFGIGANKDKLVNDWISTKGMNIEVIYENKKYLFYITDYNPKNRNLTISYNNRECQIAFNRFLDCSFGRVVGKITSEFKIEVGTRLKDDKRDITIIDRKKEISKNGIEHKYYKYYCNKCNFDCSEHYKNGEYKKEYWILESGIFNGSGCACCCNQSQIVVQGINDIVTTDLWMLIYFKDKLDGIKYSSGVDTKVRIICPDCGCNKHIAINKLCTRKTIGCSCGDGQKYPNKFMTSILRQLEITFEAEYTPKWISPLRYDFYISSMNLIIEMDGVFHKKDNKMSGQTADESKAIDDYKDEQARLHDIKVIRIDCNYGDNDRFKYIKGNILNNDELNELFDLTNIDFLKSDEFGMSNLVKMVYDFWNNKSIDETTLDISNKTGYRRITIIEFLKRGTRHGWCKYSADEEKLKNYEKQKDRNKVLHSKPVEIFKNSTSLGVFISATNLEKQSRKLFGTILHINEISKVCLGRKEQYKGFTFRHISKEDYEVRKCNKTTHIIAVDKGSQQFVF